MRSHLEGRLTYSRGRRYIVRSMFFTLTQQLTCDWADSIHTFPKRYTPPRLWDKQEDCFNQD